MTKEEKYKIMKKEINFEIPFSAKDYEIGKLEYTIPDGYLAEIKDGKVILKKENSEKEINKLVSDKLISLGFPFDVNGNFHTYNEVYDMIKNEIINTIKKEIPEIITEKKNSFGLDNSKIATLFKETYMKSFKEGINSIVTFLLTQIKPESNSISQWKPTNEQMEVLRKYVLGEWRTITIKQDEQLKHLYLQLKELM